MHLPQFIFTFAYIIVGLIAFGLVVLAVLKFRNRNP